jgi:hypothetical protein
MRCEHVRIVGVKHRGLDRMLEQGLRVVHQVGVEWVVARDEHRDRRAPGPARAPGLLP